jgi:hypothetical protein
VNNGVSTYLGPPKQVPIEEFAPNSWRSTPLGHVAVTQASIDGLRAGPVRIVAVGSISGRLATAMHRPHCHIEIRAQRDYGRCEAGTALQGIDVI